MGATDHSWDIGANAGDGWRPPGKGRAVDPPPRKEKVMGTSQGKFVWYELATSDVPAAIAFYEDVIGWGTEDFDGAGMRYVRWTADGTAVGGAMPLSEESRRNGAPPHWMAYVLADDVDALTEKARSLGGNACMPPTDIPSVGRFSIISDPGGAVIAMLEPTGPDVPELTEVPDRHFVWNELMAADQEVAFRFYSQLFGWQKTEAVRMPTGTYQMYGRKGRTLGGMMTRPSDYPAPPHWLHYVMVADLDDAVARAKKGGGRVLHGPMEVPGGSRIARCVDPQGAIFALNGV